MLLKKINIFFKKILNKTTSKKLYNKYVPEVCDHCGENIIVDVVFFEKNNFCKRCYLLKNKIEEYKIMIFSLKEKFANLEKEKINLIESINRNNIFNNTYPDNKQELDNTNLIIKLNEIKQSKELIYIDYDKTINLYNSVKNEFDNLKVKEKTNS